MVDEYYAIKHLSGLGYKLYSVIRIMTKENKADSEGWVCISFNALATKMGTSKSSIARVIADVEKFPEVIEVWRGTVKGSSVTKFRVNSKLLR